LFGDWFFRAQCPLVSHGAAGGRGKAVIRRRHLVGRCGRSIMARNDSVHLGGPLARAKQGHMRSKSTPQPVPLGNTVGVWVRSSVISVAGPGVIACGCSALSRMGEVQHARKVIPRRPRRRDGYGFQTARRSAPAVLSQARRKMQAGCANRYPSVDQRPGCQADRSASSALVAGASRAQQSSSIPARYPARKWAGEATLWSVGPVCPCSRRWSVAAFQPEGARCARGFVIQRPGRSCVHGRGRMRPFR